ncbi:type VI secretion system lipoprotein TssJ [Colwellia sp. E2M01]|uniref:type VI secretion system lipoprotein TssJ n=1 Tax=Colwellia sp. E2M01 TaxID=2841561 RepID=UPI001C098D70|nr:type VI secretion system lipoprotein TssJ [Colwellia sp. E2M01]MBU2870470.1 type VI secretion system lipoprotein TssJ [Colwellia sp. E2M01]
MTLKKIYIALAVSINVLLMTSCSTINAIIPPSTDVNFNASEDINPDMNGRASPVVIKVLELSSRTIFDTQDFFTLYESPEDILGPDLLRKDELELQPDELKKYKMELDKNTRYVGFVVAYRDIDSSRWRSVIEVSPTGYDTFTMNIEKLAIYISNK